MEAGIIIEGKIGSYKVSRAPVFRLIKERRQISMAELHLHDEDYSVLNNINIGDSANITFGYRDGLQARFSGIVMQKPCSEERNIAIIYIAGNEYKLAGTFICESYNNESPAAIIKILASQAGVDVGSLEVGQDYVDHIIFSNITIWQAFAQLREMLIRNGTTDDLDYWFYKGRLYWGIKNQPTKYTLSKTLILSHSLNYLENYLVIPLAANIDYSELISISDERRNITGTYRINYLEHFIDGLNAKTTIGYSI